ncbi:MULTISPECIES: Crp/Fnr family transcriptional regulator [Listeria]|uniref:Crp/Fnr family transcriptional regulator n=1 Tax=Listeria TaxID=1637 RepID=UPI000B596FA9|nr:MULTISPECIES: Crp/Fnr family transcriptional regulator [Listeria]
MLLKGLDYHNLYDEKAVTEDFSQAKLLDLLLNDNIYPIKRKKMLIKKNELNYLIENDDELVFALETGVAAVYNMNIIIDFVGPEEFIGLHENSLSGVNDTFFQSISNDMQVWKFSKSDVLGKVISTQEGYLYHYNYLKSILNRYLKKIISQNLTNATKTLQLIQFLTNRFGEELGEDIAIPKIFTRRVMANYLGISQTTLSTILAELQERKIIRIKGNHILLKNRF